MKIYKNTLLFIVLACSFLFFADICFAQKYCCRFYEHINTEGDYFESETGGRSSLGSVWNDKISSVWVREGCEVTIYEHFDFAGKKQTLYGEKGGTSYNLTDTRFNDIMSSYKVRTSSSENNTFCIFYEHINKGGQYLEGEPGSKERIGTYWNDKISSVWVEDGYKLTIYEHFDFAGRKQKLYGERGGTFYNLTETNFNDMMSSYKIEKYTTDKTDKRDRYRTPRKKDRYKDRHRRDRDREPDTSAICKFYEFADKKGAYFEGKSGNYRYLRKNWNDKISSVWVEDGYTVTIYEDFGFAGIKKILHGRRGGTLYNLAGINFDNMMSSYKIEDMSDDGYRTPRKKDRYKDSHRKKRDRADTSVICRFYKYADKGGAYFEGKLGNYRYLEKNWNDKISSVWIRDGYTVTIYEDSGFAGQKKILHGRRGGTLYNLAGINFDNVMSSYRIEDMSDDDYSDRTPRKKDRYKDTHRKKRDRKDTSVICIFYVHTDKRGAYLKGKSGSHGYVGKNWNDKISSVWVGEGYILTIYEHSDFAGRKKVLYGKKGGELYNLTDFNDIMSSYKLERIYNQIFRQ